MFSMIQRVREQRDGFTLVELLVVLVILGILAAIVVPSFLNSTDKANEAQIKQDLNTVYKAAAAERASDETGAWPSATDLYAVVEENEPGITLAGTEPADDGTIDDPLNDGEVYIVEPTGDDEVDVRGGYGGEEFQVTVDDDGEVTLPN